MSKQRRRNETHTRFASSHVAQASDVHEQVATDQPSIQRRKEAPGHSTGRE
ncbi:MAG: hypothetical protein ABWY04_03265 [Arthrobacter sp.]